jgi:ABC-type multidrug transport system ATPase subunit
MNISLQNLGKRFQYEWIFRKLNLEFQENQIYTIIGSNGSGKSTLLQIIAGSLSPSEGKITYQKAQKNIPVEDIYKSISICTPYLELIEELTLKELIRFHIQFKPFRNNLTIKDFIEIIRLEKAENKPIQYFSSGMKQRLKLGLSFYSDTPLLLLDEPTNNLDQQGIDWYLDEIAKNIENRLTIICSNQPYEYAFCQNLINIMDYKGNS